MIALGRPKVWMCGECSIVYDFERRFQYAQENDAFKYFGSFDHCGCDKIDGKLWAWHGCEDAWVDVPNIHPKGKRKTGRAYRRMMRARKCERRKNISFTQRYSGTFCAGMDKTNMPVARPYQLWEYGIDDDNVKYTYIKMNGPSKRKQLLKRYANKMFRREDFIGRERSYHKKVYNVMWELE